MEATVPKINSRQDKHWHLDKRVPIALIFTIGVQTFGLVWWASNLTTRVSALEEKSVLVGPQGERLTRLETQMGGIKDDVSDIKSDVKLLLRTKR